NCVFGQNVAHSTFIVIFVVRAAVIGAVVTPKWIAMLVTIAGRTIAIAIATIVISVAGVEGRIGIIRISVGFVWVVAPVPVPPGTPRPWKAEVADKDDFLEAVEATKPIISTKVDRSEERRVGKECRTRWSQ